MPDNNNDSATGSEDKLLSRKAAARRLGISVRKLDDIRRDGEIACVKIGRRILFDPATLDTFAHTHVLRPRRRGGSRRG